MVQFLVTVTFTLLTITLIPAPAHPLAAATLFQLEYKTVAQSWPELGASHLMRWRCFTWINLPLPFFQSRSQLIDTVT